MSFKQLLYIGGGIGFLFILYLVTESVIITLLFGAPVCAVAGLLAFFHLNNQPFIVILQSMLQFAAKKRMYVWKQGEDVTHIKRKTKTQKKDQIATGNKTNKVQNLGHKLIFDDNQIGGDEPDVTI